jgi:DNA-directed RNA polymerase specialized sigma subunit
MNNSDELAVGLLKDRKFMEYTGRLMYNKFGTLYSMYSDSVPEWILLGVRRFNPERKVRLKNYIIKWLHYQMYHILRDDPHNRLREQIVPIDVSDLQIASGTSGFVFATLELKEALKTFMDQLTIKSRIDIGMMLSDYFGIDTDRLKTGEICKKYGISREYVRQLKQMFLDWIKWR